MVLQVLADAVARLVVDKFSDLTENFSSPHARRKVLAGIVMTTGKLKKKVVCWMLKYESSSKLTFFSIEMWFYYLIWKMD